MVKSYTEMSNQVNELSQDQNKKVKSASPVKHSAAEMPDIEEIA